MIDRERLIDKLFDAYEAIGLGALTYALLDEVAEAQTRLVGQAGLKQADEMVSMMRAYLDGDATIDACFDLSATMQEKVARVIPGSNQEQALLFYQSAVANLPEGATCIDANYFTLESLAGFWRYWERLTEIEATDRLLTNLQATLTVRPWDKLGPLLRERVSLLAH